MKNERMTIWLVVATVAVMTARVQGQSFELTGSDEKDVTSWYQYGYLYDFSRARVLAGGSVDVLFGHDSSTVAILGGTAYNLYAYHSSTMDIVDGRVSYLNAWHSSTVAISGGSIHCIEAFDTSLVNISDGSVSLLGAYNLNSNSRDRINITGGSVGGLYAGIDVVRDEHFSLTKDISLLDLADYGIQTADGTVGYVFFESLYARDTSKVDISGGSVWRLEAFESSTVHISDGSVNDILCVWDTSRVEISGGSIDDIHAMDNSAVHISGGNLEFLWAYETSFITFLGKEFVLGEGLRLIDYELIGTGTLSGQWLDGTQWSTEITYNADTATILLIPEPATLLLLSLGGLALRYRKR